ncbi:virulence factor mce family protein [Mycolicibacterium conceptionense]|nr:virulence factor mce family protein [Mycolicibacterium conceptionense]
MALPGAVGRGPGALTYHIAVANVGVLEPNSPVMIDDVVVGSIASMRFTNWHADVEISVNPDTPIPANATASIGQSSLLGSMHLAINTPLGQPPTGRLPPGATIPLNRTSTAPSTERTLSSLSAVVNAGGLGQIGDIISNFNAAFSGREGDIRSLLTRLDNVTAVIDTQRDHITESIRTLDRFGATVAAQRDTLTTALRRIPPALDVLRRERPHLTTALDKLRVLSNTSVQFINDSKDDLTTNLRNLEPTLRAFTELGDDLDTALAYTFNYPLSQSFIDRAVRGDYANLYVVVDFTVPRLKRTLFLGTRWGQEGAELVPAPGDPWFQNYTYDPLRAGVSAPPQEPPNPAGDDPQTLPPPDAAPMPAMNGPVLPVTPPPPLLPTELTSDPAPPAGPAPIFAGPYGHHQPPTTPGTAPAGAGG